jgi:serine/threonine protein kinase
VNAPTPEGNASDSGASEPLASKQFASDPVTSGDGTSSHDVSWKTQADPVVQAQSDWSSQKETYPIDRASGDDPTLPPGFRLDRELGRGGMSVVFLAMQSSLNREVALKRLLTGQLSDNADRERFRREAEAIARLQHPNFVQVYETGETRAGPYLVMEYVRGGTLRDRINNRDLTPQEGARLVELIARAMHVAHGAGLIHRDLKPGNILMTRDGVPKVADFGIVKRSSEPGMTKTGEILGTPGYMAPEQASGMIRETTASVDVYAMGAILYEILTGRPPHRGMDAIETLLLSLSEEPPTPRRLSPRIPVDLETICLKCLEKKPGARYASALDLADDLHRYLDGQPILARPTPLWERARKWIVRHPAWSTTIGVSTIALIATFAIMTAYSIWLAEEKSVADQNLATARKMISQTVDFLVADTPHAQEGLLDDRRRRLIETSLAFHEEYVRLNEKRLDLRGEIAETSKAIADLSLILGDTQRARREYANARARLQSTLRDRPNDVEAQFRLALVAEKESQIHRRLGDVEAAEKSLKEAVDLMDSLPNTPPGEDDLRIVLGRILNNYAIIVAARGRIDEAKEINNRAHRLRESVLLEFPKDPSALVDMATTLASMANLEMASQNRDEAAKLLAEAEKHCDAIKNVDPGDLNAIRIGISIRNNRHTLLLAAGDIDGALATLAKAEELAQSFLAEYPGLPEPRERLADILWNRGVIQMRSGKHAAAIESLADAEAQYHRLFAQFPETATYGRSELRAIATQALTSEDLAVTDPSVTKKTEAIIERADVVLKELLKRRSVTLEELITSQEFAMVRYFPTLAKTIEAAANETPSTPDEKK